MELTPSSIVLAAKNRQIQQLRHLASRVELVGAIGHLVHALQSERGASSLFVASGGSRFGQQRTQLAEASSTAEAALRERFRTQLDEPGFGNASLISLIAWVVLGLDTLPALRERIAAGQVKADEVVIAYSRLIAGLLSVIFDVADSTVDPAISRRLVALFNLVQGKELAGQERAVGSALLASGTLSQRDQQRILHLIETQERNIQIFCEFAGRQFVDDWDQMQVAPCMVQIERLRRVLCASAPSSALDSNLSDTWFGACTERIDGMWRLQEQLLAEVREACACLVDAAEKDLADASGLLKAVATQPPESARLVERFLGPELALDGSLGALPAQGSEGESPLLQVLQEQKAKLAAMEAERDAARRALNERKIIERAKGVLMARFSMPEDEAYRTLRKTSMEQNRRLYDVAEATLAVLASIATDKV
ncbi:MAG: nitrate- and nitrite sensing domain-containing protein [Rhodocyclaceae bacterium]|nr:nitrate- and nitrite sensing domain-containing protein [Rhodocyclaceae bacterium]